MKRLLLGWNIWFFSHTIINLVKFILATDPESEISLIFKDNNRNGHTIKKNRIIITIYDNVIF